MIEWLNSVVQCLNNNAGVVAALSVLVAIVVPCCLYQKGKRDKKKDLQSELEAMNESHNNMTADARQEAIRRSTIYKQLTRK